MIKIGKLADLWQNLRDTDFNDPKRADIQEEINKIERYMIKKGWKTDGETKWYDNEQSVSVLYPHHSGAVYFEDLYMVADLNGKGINYGSDGSVHVCEDCNF